MNKLILALLALCIGIASALYVTTHKTTGTRIAILLPAIHPAMDEIERGFKETFQQAIQTYAFDTFNASGNKTLLHALAEEITNQNYDLVFTVGALTTHTMHTLIDKKQLTIPQVFTAIEDPANMGITPEARAAGAQITGTYVADNFDEQLNYLLKIKPSTKQLLFVYDPTHGSGMEKIVDEIQVAAQRAGITVKTAQVFASNELTQKVEPLLSHSDALLIYTDHTTVSGIDSLIKLCNQYGVTLYASDLNSGAKGASLAYGVQEYDHGKEAAVKALSILDDYQQASTVPITPISNYKLLINKSTMHAQGLILSDRELTRLKQDATVLIKERP